MYNLNWTLTSIESIIYVRCQKLVAIIKVLSVCDSATVFYSEFYFASIYLMSVVRQDHILLVTF